MLYPFVFRFFAYLQQASEIARDPAMAYVPREKWDDFDPQLIAEGLFAAANVFSALKLVHLFSINPHLGPLQISLGRMVIDIVKFFFIYSLVLFAFACGLNQLLWYFADLEKSKCYVLPDGEADWTGHADSCMKWRRFGKWVELISKKKVVYVVRRIFWHPFITYKQYIVCTYNACFKPYRNLAVSHRQDRLTLFLSLCPRTDSADFSN